MCIKHASTNDQIKLSHSKIFAIEANDLGSILTYVLLLRNATRLSTRWSRFSNSIINSYHGIANKSCVQLESYAVEDFTSSSRNLVSSRVIPHLEHVSVRGNAVHGHPLYLVCPDVLRVVCEIYYGIRMEFSLFPCLFICIWRAKEARGGVVVKALH